MVGAPLEIADGDAVFEIGQVERDIATEQVDVPPNVGQTHARAVARALHPSHGRVQSAAATAGRSPYHRCQRSCCCRCRCCRCCICLGRFCRRNQNGGAHADNARAGAEFEHALARPPARRKEGRVLQVRAHGVCDGPHAGCAKRNTIEPDPHKNPSAIPCERIPSTILKSDKLTQKISDMKDG
jgi:hypothetical protein